jgi:hypothetical protein
MVQELNKESASAFQNAVNNSSIADNRECLGHPPFIPDLARSKFHFCASLKRQLEENTCTMIMR